VTWDAEHDLLNFDLLRNHPIGYFSREARAMQMFHINVSDASSLYSGDVSHLKVQYRVLLFVYVPLLFDPLKYIFFKAIVQSFILAPRIIGWDKCV